VTAKSIESEVAKTIAGYRERDGNNRNQIRIDPLLASLRGDPRFEALAENIVPAREFGASSK